MTNLLIFTLALWSTSAFGNAEEKGLQFAKKVHALDAGFRYEYARIHLSITDAHGESIDREFELFTKEEPRDGQKTLIHFLSPKRVKGTKLLTWGHKKGSDDQWLYLPKPTGKVFRISGGRKAGAFMSSEFSYEDLGSQEVEKYTYKMLGEDPPKLERFPKDEDSGYKKQVVTYSKEHQRPIKVESYNQRDELLKTATLGPYEKHGKNFLRATKIKMVNHQTKRSSTFTWSESTRVIGKKIPDHKFDSNSLAD